MFIKRNARMLCHARLLGGLVLAGALPLGCARLATPLPAADVGTAVIMYDPGRQVQYKATAIDSMDLTLKSRTSGQVYTKQFAPPTIVNGIFTFKASGLPLGTYDATLSANVGTKNVTAQSATASFLITANSQTPVTFSNLKLAASPVGSWQITVTPDFTALSGGGWKATNFEYRLAKVDGTVTASQSFTVSKTTSDARTWANVIAFPAGKLSTTSILVTATSGATTKKATASVTATMSENQTAVSSITVQFK
ncbi:MAG TPA: hypothetical protein V6D05_14790 [Stenomitos sp.]